MIDISVRLSSIDMANPSMLASGILDETGDSLRRMMEAGAGAVVTKSIGMEPNPGHSNPCLVELPYGYVNAMGLPNPGVESFSSELVSLMPSPVPVIASVYAANEKDFAFVSGRMEMSGAAAIELNLSCPHASGFGMEIGIDPVKVSSIVSAVKEAVSVPVFAKLTPNTHDIVAIGKAVEDAGGDGVVAINTLRAMVISPEFGCTVLSNRYGGLSGPAIKPIGVRAVYDLYEALNIPVVGVGGIETWRDAAEYIMAGATCFQIGSVIGRRGPEAFMEIVEGLRNFMLSYGYQTIKDMRGIAHD